MVASENLDWHLLLPAAAVNQAEAHLRAAEQKAPPGEYAERVSFHRFGQDYTRCMLELLDHYRRFTELGVKLQFSTRQVTKAMLADEPAGGRRSFTADGKNSSIRVG
jgi:hypothetical protein